MPSVLDIYLKSDDAPASSAAPIASGSIIDTYLKKDALPEAPISQGPAPTRFVIHPPNARGETQSPYDPALHDPQPEPAYVPPPSVDRLYKGLTKDIPRAITSLPTNYAHSVKEAYQGGVDIGVSGIKDLSDRNYLPNTSSTNLENWSAGGLLKTLVGPVAAAVSPITGAIKELIEKPVANLTGSKEIGEKAGLVAGTAIPVAPSARAVKNAIPTNRAINGLIETIGRENLPQVIDRMEKNPRLALIDAAGEGIRQMGQKLATTEGKGADIIRNAIEARTSGSSLAVNDAFDKAMGTPVNVVEKLNDMKSAAKNVGKNEIQPAIQNAKPVDLTPVLAHIDAQLKPGINSIVSNNSGLPSTAANEQLGRIRKLFANEKNQRVDADTLHNFQSTLRGAAERMLNSPSGLERQVGYSVMQVRNKLVDAIDMAADGKYKPALSKYKDEMHIQDAFDKGYLVTKNRPGQWEDRPEFWAQWIKNASKEELEAAREGARIAVDSQIRGMRNTRGLKGTEVIQTEFNKDKLGMLFGKKEITEMERKLLDERDIAQRNVDLVGGSQTAMRMKANSVVDLPTHKEPSLASVLAGGLTEAALMTQTGSFSGVGLAAGMGTHKAVNYLKDKTQTNLAKRKNSVLAEMIMAPEGPSRDTVIDILKQHVQPVTPNQSLLLRGQNALSKVIAP